MKDINEILKVEKEISKLIMLYNNEVIEKNKGKKKNLIVFHLESISNEIFYSKRTLMPNLENLINNSINLKKFYSTVTSSAMAMIDFFHGNSLESDNSSIYDQCGEKRGLGIHLYDKLRNEGYRILGIGYPAISDPELDKYKVWSNEGYNFRWHKEFGEFIEGIENHINEGREEPFAIYAWNMITHLGHSDKFKNKGTSFMDKMTIAYKELDETIRRIVDYLNDKNLLDDTIIVAFGDHGDDKWTRALNSGRCHVIEPYINLIHTPAFIYNPELQPVNHENLVSLIDLKNTILYTLGIEEDKTSKYLGKNVLKENNEYVYARNLFDNQIQIEEIKSKEMIKLNNNSNISERNKAYCIVNKDYNLIVSDNGMEMFAHTFEPCNYNNLLSFFNFDNEGNIISFDNKGAWRGHFRQIMMAKEQQENITSNFKELKEELYRYIEKRVELIDNVEVHKFNMDNFKRVKDRDYLWN